MKAIKVFIDEREQFKMLNLIEKFNSHEDIAAAGTGQTDFVVAASGCLLYTSPSPRDTR